MPVSISPQVSDSGVYQLRWLRSNLLKSLCGEVPMDGCGRADAEQRRRRQVKAPSLGSGVHISVCRWGDLVCTVEIADEGGRDVAGTLRMGSAEPMRQSKKTRFMKTLTEL